MLGFHALSAAPLSGTGTSIVVDEVLETGTGVDIFAPVIIEEIDETASATDSVDQQVVSVVTETGTATDTITETTDLVDSILDLGVGADSLQSFLEESLLEQGSGADTIDEQILNFIEEQGAGTDSISEILTLQESILEQGSGVDEIKETIVGLFQEAGTGSDTVVERNESTDIILETGTAADSIDIDQAEIVNIVLEQGTAADLVAESVDAVDTVLEDGSGEVVLRDGENLSAWTAHVETFGMSRYTSIPVGEISNDGDKIVGTGLEGLFVLDSAKDNGQRIDAEIQSDKTDFDSQRLKRPRELFIGFSSPGLVEVKLTQHESGKEQTHRYRIERRKADVAVPGRAKLGRGFKSRYFDIRIRNVSGASFKLHDAQLVVDDTSRSY